MRLLGKKIIAMPSIRFVFVHGLCFSFLIGWGSPLAAQLQPIVPKSTTRAVVVGISNYENIEKLRFAHKDAEAFAQYLGAAAGGRVPEANIQLLTNEKATLGGIGKALAWLISESQAGDRAIIYFSGHGDVETQMTNEGYLLAYDANKTTYMAGGALPIHSLQRAITTLSVTKQVQVLLIADACRSGNLAGTETNGSKTTALAMAAQFANEVKIMSCGPDEVSLEDEEWGGGRSVFSYYLMDGLRGLADANEDREVTLREIQRFLQDSVERATQSKRLQTPRTGGDDKVVVARVDAQTLAALRRKNNPETPFSANTGSKSPQNAAFQSDSAMLRRYRQFEASMQKNHLLEPENDAAYTIYQQIKDHPSIQPYKNPMRNDLAAALQDEAQKAINDYLSADPREMRRRWGLDARRYRLYPIYLEKAAELLGEGHFSYPQVKAREHYFSGLNLRLQGEASKRAAEKDSLYREAKRLQEKTLQLDSTAAYAYNELGLLARRFGQYEPSAAYFNQALRFSPRWVLPWVNLCGIYNDLGQWSSAEKCGLKAVLLDSTFALAHYNLGCTYSYQNQAAKAIPYFQKTLAYNPDYVNAYDFLGHSYYELGDFVKAEALWEECSRRMPDNPTILQNLGEVSLKLGKGAAHSEALFKKAIAVDSSYSRAYTSLGELFLAKNEYAESEKWFARVVSMEPENAEAYFFLATAQHTDAPKALASLEIALKKGFLYYERLKNEKHLAALRNKPAYKKLLQTYFPGK